VLLALPFAGELASGSKAQEPNGTISGEVRMGTAGASLSDAVAVELIALDADGGLTTQETVTSGGRFEFRVVADAAVTYLVRVDLDGVRYFAEQPALVSAELPSAELSIVVYAATGEQPQLLVESTTLTVIVLDRARRQLTLERQDVVVNLSDRTYTGNGGGITLRLPAPEGVIETSGVGVDGAFTLEGGRLATSMPLRPGRTTVVTHYLVGYDPVEDRYRLRATAPLETGAIALRVPAAFAGKFELLGETRRVADIEIEGERVLVAERSGGLRPGESAVMELRGLSGRNEPNPLTERSGALAGAGIALIVLVAGFAAVHQLLGRRVEVAER
jgi:hypothetical protein